MNRFAAVSNDFSILSSISSGSTSSAFFAISAYSALGSVIVISLQLSRGHSAQPRRREGHSTQFCPNKHRQSAILYHILLVSFLFHLHQLNSVLVLLLQLLDRLLHIPLLVAPSTRLLVTPSHHSHVVERREHDERQHDPQKHVVLEHPRHVPQVLDLHAENAFR